MSPSALRLVATAVGTAALLAAAQAMALPVPGSTPAQVTSAGFVPLIAQSGNTMTVDLRANRTIIDWSSFNIASGESVTFAFDGRSWIALNRVPGGQISINGQLSSIFANAPAAGGPAGGNVWLYSPQGVAFGPNARVDVGGLLATSSSVDPAAFLVTGSLSYTLTGSGNGGPVTVAPGAVFNSVGGINLLAPVVTTAAGSTFNASHQRGTIVYGAADTYDIRMRIIETGDLALFDFVVPNGAAGTASSTPLNLAGSTQAANIFILATGRQGLSSILINAPGLLVASSSTANEGQVKIGSARQLIGNDFNYLDNVQVVPGAPSGSIAVGTIRAAGYATLMAMGDTTLGDFTADSVTAGSTIGIAARNVTVGSGGLNVVGTGLGVPGEQAVVVDAFGTVRLPTASSPTDVLVFRGNNQIGRSTARPIINIQSANAGNRVRLFGDIVTAGTLTAGALIEGNYNGLTAQSLTAPTITLNGLGTAAPFTLNSVNATGAVTLANAGNVTFGTTTAGSLDVTANVAMFGRTTVAGDARLQVLGPDFLDLFTAKTLVVEARSGSMNLGGPGNIGLTNSEFQNLRLPGGLTLYGGPNVAGGVRGDLTVLDLDIDPAKVPSLTLLAGPDNAVKVTGVARPTTSGGAIRIGETAADSPWTPKTITITGAFGSAKGDALAGFTEVKAFKTVELYAKTDILIGSQRFIDLVKDVPAAQIDIGRGLPTGVAAVDQEIGKLYLVAGSLKAAASDRIVQQNTGAAGQQAGFFLTGDGVDAKDPLLTIGKAQIADMFGALQIGDGIFTTGSQASFSTRIARLEGDTSLGFIRINGCQLSVGCALSTPATEFRISAFRPAATRAAIDPPILTPPLMDEDELETEGVIAGTGNEEIWRKEK